MAVLPLILDSNNRLLVRMLTPLFENLVYRHTLDDGTTAANSKDRSLARQIGVRLRVC
jgi:hypothetical protein